MKRVEPPVALSCFWDIQFSHPFLFSFGWFPLFLLSLAWGVLAWGKRRLPEPGFVPKVPVFCVGNLTSGGAGKTPVVAALAAHFSARRPVLISRGYRGTSEKKGARVDVKAQDGAALFGDEPWMLANQTGLPVYVGQNRAASVKEAEAQDDPGLFIFDDGFQNRQVRYTKKVLLWNPDSGPEAHYCLPLGTLREPLSAANHADVVLLAQKSGAAAPTFPCLVNPGTRILAGNFLSEGPFAENGASSVLNSKKKFGAFCGIGNPPPFFKAAAGMGAIAYEKPFPDHYWYTPSDIQWLNQVAESNGLDGWLTTEKDWYRLGPARKQLRHALYWTRLTARLGLDFFQALESPKELS